MKEQQNKQHLDKIRGCLIGGAAGDALGYAVEFDSEGSIFAKYGSGGIRAYALDPSSGKALISDDTQMTLFTANGLLFAETRVAMRGIGGQPSMYMLHAYKDWLRTQEMSFSQAQKDKKQNRCISWLSDVPELYHQRAPGNTCLSALYTRGNTDEESYIDHPINHSKGCGGVMRVAPMGLKRYLYADIKTIDREGAELAAITHGHSLGYMPAAVLTHIVHQIVYSNRGMTLKEIVEEARDTVAEIFVGDRHLNELTSLIDTAIALSEKDPVAPAKIIKEYADKIETFEIKAGFVDGGLLDAAGVGTLASIPSKETLIAKMLGSMMAPLYSFARVLQAKIDKDGGAPAEAPAEA